MTVTGKKDRRYAALSFLFLLAALLLIGALAGGEILTPDSPSYIAGSLARDGLYPGFLAILRAVFGADAYLTAAVFLQDVFLAVALWALCLYLKKAFRLPVWLAWGSVCLCLLGVVAESFVSMKRLLMSHCIMTEGLAMPLVLLSFRFLLAGVLEKRFSPLYGSLLFIFPSLMLRGQLWFLLILWFLATCYVAARQRARFLRFVSVACVCALVGVAGSAGGKLLHLALNGRYVGTQFGKTTIAAKLMYLSTEEDAALFTGDPQAQSFFTGVYAQAISDEDNVRFAGEGFLGRTKHYAGCYNDLLYLNMKPELTAAVDSALPEIDSLVAKNGICGRMIVPLLKAHPAAYLSLTADSVLLGLIRSNSALLLNNEQLPAALEASWLQYACLGWSAFLYLLAAVLTVLAFRRDRDSRAGWMMLFSFVLLLGNIAPNALTYNVISRYAIFAVLPFYLSLLMLLWETLFKKGQRDAS